MTITNLVRALKRSGCLGTRLDDLYHSKFEGEVFFEIYVGYMFFFAHNLVKYTVRFSI